MTEKKQDAIDRLKELIDNQFDGNQSKFGRKIKVGQSTISSCLVNKKREVSSTIVSGLLEFYPELNLKWLILGQGEMLLRKANNIMNDPPVTYGEVSRKEFLDLKKRVTAIEDTLKGAIKNADE